MISTEMQTESRIEKLVCFKCGATHNHQEVQTISHCCNRPLSANYQIKALSKTILNTRPMNMWRYREMLPVMYDENIISLGEGFTPILPLTKLSAKIGLNHLSIKDESVNPTGSFKARGLSMGVSKGKELGIKEFIIPTAGNAGGALSAYCAKADIKATVIMPTHTASTLKEECKLYGANLILVDGLIDACGKLAGKIAEETGAFNISTMKEPYRLEGKKTMGYEIAEQLNWQLPDVIVYPAGGGTGLIGIWKAFHEMKEMGWIQGRFPRLVLVQSENCSPMIHLFEKGVLPENYAPTASSALGLAVPYPFATDMMLESLYQSGGTAITVSENEMDQGIEEIANSEGLLLSPEGAATYMGLKKLMEKDWIKENEEVLLINTGSWYKYR
jgi:threonine synthase